MFRLSVRFADRRRFASPIAVALAAFAVLACWLGATKPARAQAAFRDDHESAAAAWRPGASDTRYRVLRQARVQDAARSGESCELISLDAGIGSFVYFAYPIGQARVIDELRPTVWMKSNRQGLQVLARIVLPHTLDPRTDSAATVLVRGDSYTQVGQWQRLTVDRLPKALDEQVRVLRARLKVKVDPREAYVDQVVVNLYGGQGRALVWLDDLDVPGFVGKRPDQHQADVAIAEPRSTADNPAGDRPRVELNGDILLVDGKPFFPRMIEYRGEPLGELARLGFNAIWLRGAATTAFLGEADRAGLRVVCPPPEPLPPSFGGDYDGVLAWNLGHHLATAELDAVTQLAAVLRKRDPGGRPLIAQADSQLLAYSRVADILLIDRPVLGTSLELADYARYLNERPRLARPGTPFWVAIDLDLDPRVVNQIAALAPNGLRTAPFDADSVRQVTLIALAAGARGLLFNTHAAIALDERRTVVDPAAGDVRGGAADRKAMSARGMELALLNRELQLCQPWLAEGQRAVTTRDPSAPASLSMIQSRRGKLLIAARILPGGQFASGAHPTGVLSLVAPGSPETDDAFALSAAGLRPLDRRRVAGGANLSWDGFGSCGVAVLSSDALLVTSLNRQSQETIRATAAYKIAAARQALAETEGVARQLGGPTAAVRQSRSGAAVASLDRARTSLGRAEQLFARGDAAAAFQAAEAASSAVALWRRAAWEQAVRGWPSPVGCPLAVTSLTLVEQSQFAGRASRAVVGRNSLAEGDCENLPAMIEAGWRHWRHTLADITTHVELSPASPFAGQSSLYLAAATGDASLAETLIETPPVWVVTAPVQFSADTAVRIRGRVRIPRPITGSVDGLEIIDSLGGPALAMRIGHAPEWQEFTLYRYASRLDRITVTFALSGLGEAWIDNVAVEPVALGAPGSPIRAAGTADALGGVR